MNLTGKRILIVDDEEEIVEVISSIMEPTGITIETAHDGRSGLELIKSRKFDLVLSDIKMHGIDGYQLISAVKKSGLNKRTPIVVMTGYIDEKEERALRLGAVKIFIKPIRTMELLEWIEKRIALAAIDIEKFKVALASGVGEVLGFYLQEKIGSEFIEQKETIGEDGLNGTIHFIGGDFKGYMGIMLENPMIKAIGAMTFGEEYEDDFASEIVGELCNQCLGKVIAHFSKIDVNLSLDIGIPEVITVSDREPHFHHASNYYISILFHWQHHRCVVELVMN